MTLLRCLLLLSCLSLLWGGTQGTLGAPFPAFRPVHIPEGSPFFIPTLNMTSATVMRVGGPAPSCIGDPLITLEDGAVSTQSPALADRVRKELYDERIVIDDATRSDQGLYTLCNNSSEPVLVVALIFTE
ncbi:uncharacterized protein LOC144752897 [Lissotriton helveticus]